MCHRHPSIKDSLHLSSETRSYTGACGDIKNSMGRANYRSLNTHTKVNLNMGYLKEEES